MHILLRFSCVSTLALFLLSCGAPSEPEPEDADDIAALLAELRTRSYRAWDPAVGFEDRTVSNTAHSNRVTIYINDVVADALSETGLTEWPNGSVIVKDAFPDDTGPNNLVAAMEKKDGQWYFGEWRISGETNWSLVAAGREGTPSGGRCTGCHGSNNDRVLAVTLP